jgi:hypothetical protein
MITMNKRHRFLYIACLYAVRHGKPRISARGGGVSKGPYASLNLSFTRPEELRENVMENYRLLPKPRVLGGSPW